ncbi:hypothetical protein [Peribacillus saganii]|uniref:hypothetical protein n=1 Tax=Peribacillus saganii TaxID=2303992 RepID=UPI00227833FD|nr:hypothetical protein [Peribacillus saganii]
MPLNGDVGVSENGMFRVERADTEFGDYVFYMKLKHKDTYWRIGYAFDSKEARMLRSWAASRRFLWGARGRLLIRSRS